MLTLSFIVPIYNTEDFVRDCLNSILSQIDQFPGSEIIVVDDGSTDGSFAIVQDLVSSYDCISIIKQENGGLSRARNAGLRIAKGDYVWYVDSDDWITSSALKELRESIEKHPNCDIYLTAFAWTYGDNPFRVDIDSRDVSYASGKEYLQKKGVIAAQKFIVKRSLLEHHSLYFMPGIFHEDGHFGLRLLYYADGIYVLPNPIYMYRQRMGSIMHSVTIKNAYDCVTIHKDLMNNLISPVDASGDFDWFRLECRRVLFFCISIVKPIWGTKEFDVFMQAHGAYLRKEARKCIPLASGKTKILLSLYSISPKWGIKLVSLLNSSST